MTYCSGEACQVPPVYPQQTDKATIAGCNAACNTRDWKGVCWQCQQRRVQQPEHVVQRVLLILALATLWMVALGQRVVRAGWRRRTDGSFQLGLQYLQYATRQWQHLPSRPSRSSSPCSASAQ